LAAPLVGHRAGDDAASQTHDERHGAERAGEHGIDRERLLNVDEDERENGEVEAIEHPAEERGDERTPLIARQFPGRMRNPEWHFFRGFRTPHLRTGWQVILRSSPTRRS